MCDFTHHLCDITHLYIVWFHTSLCDLTHSSLCDFTQILCDLTHNRKCDFTHQNCRNMRSELVAEILQCNTETNCWESKLFVTHSGTHIDISSADKGRESTILEAAPDQPATYSKKSKYRFDTSFHGLDAFNDLKETIVGQQCCPGCTIGLRQVHHTSRESICTGGTWTFVCKKGHVEEEAKHGQFMPGEYAMKNIATPSLKKRKT